MGEFINHTNHPSARWEESQRRMAESYGSICDIPFPVILPTLTSEEVVRLARDAAREIIARRPAAVLVQGEFTYTFALVTLLKSAGVTVVSACSERHVSERENEHGERIRESRFVFCRFRAY